MRQKRIWSGGVVRTDLSDNDISDFLIGMWKDRVLTSNFRDNALKMGIASEDDLKQISDGWAVFPSIQDAVYTVIHGEMIITKPGKSAN
jgi:hypothetical protein